MQVPYQRNHGLKRNNEEERMKMSLLHFRLQNLEKE